MDLNYLNGYINKVFAIQRIGGGSNKYMTKYFIIM
jgi:hypothetical protein